MLAQPGLRATQPGKQWRQLSKSRPDLESSVKKYFPINLKNLTSPASEVILCRG
ncbi:hypothetical protein HC766_09110 [Candidatus Gracilibacteria bacterium]|nr:hypothetical protein [Candidatus Gracilibacteria bacterium]